MNISPVVMPAMAALEHARIEAANIGPADHRKAADDNKTTFLFATPGLARHHHGVRGQYALMGLQRRLFGGVTLTVIERLAQFQPCRRLNDFFYPSRIIHAR